MKTVKPQKLGLLCKSFEHERESYFVPSILVFFSLEETPRLLPEVNLWKTVEAELGKEAMLDACMPKVRGELLVTGKCFTPGGVPRPASSVRVKLGPIDKTLYVVGDRRWVRGAPSDPEPFTEMPITWERAFGGEGFAQNPIGKGIAPVRGERGEIHPLPNIELPKELLHAPNDRPPPAGFGAYDVMWPQRFSMAGTYDEAWMKDLFPGFADDTDLAMWSAAPPDQQIVGHFRGGEAFLLENMHPSRPTLEGRLPDVICRCFIQRKIGADEVLEEVEMRIDTVHFFPNVERGILIYRGVTKIQEDDASDVLQLLAACELAGEPKPASHYETVIAQRSDKKKGYLYVLRDSDLMPATPPGQGGPPPPDEKIHDMDELLAREDLIQQNARRGMERRLESLRAEVRSHGLDPAAYIPAALPEPEKAPSLEELPEFVEQSLARAEAEKKSAEQKRAAAEQEARELCEKHGLDYEKLVADAKKKSGGPPKFSARQEIEKLHAMAELSRNSGVSLPQVEASLMDPELETKLFAIEAQLRETYRRFAHHFPAAEPVGSDDARTVREEVIAGRAGGQSFAGRDLTGADLSSLDLAGVDLTCAMLESANLAGSDLRRANLTGAVLYNADLTGVMLDEAVLAGANLGSAKLRGARARGGVDMTGIVLAKADLTGADFTGARLSSADLSEAIVDGADFSGISATGLLFLNSDLSGLKLAGADLSACNFLEAKVEGTDFSGAKLVSTVFLTTKGDRAVFRGAMADNVRLVHESSFAGADFRGASLEGANFRGTCLAGSDFEGANLRGADLSECDLRGANLSRITAVEARFAKADLRGANLKGANLMLSILQKARTHGASFEGANLFRADAAHMRGDAATSFRDAHMKQVRVVAARGPDGPE